MGHALEPWTFRIRIETEGPLKAERSRCSPGRTRGRRKARLLLHGKPGAPFHGTLTDAGWNRLSELGEACQSHPFTPRITPATDLSQHPDRRSLPATGNPRQMPVVRPYPEPGYGHQPLAPRRPCSPTGGTRTLRRRRSFPGTRGGIVVTPARPFMRSGCRQRKTAQPLPSRRAAASCRS